MASEKKNPLLGAFRTPAPEAPPPAEPPKEPVNAPATGATPAAPAVGKKPTEPPQPAAEGKPVGTVPAKPVEERKPAEPPQPAAEGKPAGTASAKPAEEKKPAEPPQPAAEGKPVGTAPAKPAEERKPAEPSKATAEGKLDKLVDQIIRMQFERIKNIPPQALIERQQAQAVKTKKAELRLLSDQLKTKQKEYQDLRAETIRVIQGTSKLNPDLLNSLVDETGAQIGLLEQQIRTAETELSGLISDAAQARREYAQLISWASLYDSYSFEAKKMIVAQFVKAVHVRRDYEIDIEFNVSFEELQNLYLEGETEESKKPGTETFLAFV